MRNVEKGMIIAFFVIFGVISSLVGPPGQQSRTFYTYITSAALLRTSYGSAGLRSLPNEINGLSPVELESAVL